MRNLMSRVEQQCCIRHWRELPSRLDRYNDIVYMTHTAWILCVLCAVESPCGAGCTGLSFCTQLNERPTEMFRDCNPLSDHAARRTLQLWQSGTISLPNALTFHIPIKGINNCMSQ